MLCYYKCRGGQLDFPSSLSSSWSSLAFRTRPILGYSYPDIRCVPSGLFGTWKQQMANTHGPKKTADRRCPTTQLLKIITMQNDLRSIQLTIKGGRISHKCLQHIITNPVLRQNGGREWFNSLFCWCLGLDSNMQIKYTKKCRLMWWCRDSNWNGKQKAICTFKITRVSIERP